MWGGGEGEGGGWGEGGGYDMTCDYAMNFICKIPRGKHGGRREGAGDTTWHATTPWTTSVKYQEVNIRGDVCV